MSPTKDLFHKLRPQARILLIRLRSMGDCILLTGPIRAIKKEFPDFRISILVEPRFADCFAGNSDLEEIITTSDDKYKTVVRLLGRRFHAIINLHGGPTSRIGVKDYQYRHAYNGLMPRTKAKLHTVETTMEWFRWLGVRNETSPPSQFAVHESEAEKIRETTKERPYVVIHPAALMETKRWSAAGFAELGKMFTNRGFCVVLTCGPGEEAIVGQIAPKLPNSVILFGLSILELAELIRRAVLYVGNDAGPMHLAAAVGTPVVALWGSSDSIRWHPWAVPHRIVQNPFDCNPCAGYECLVASSPLCIDSISVEQAKQAVKALLSQIEPDKSLKKK